jgi:A/G-specific adenine glycosylase
MSPSKPNRSLNARQGTGTCSLPGFDKPPARALPCEDPVGFRDAVVEWFDAFGRQYPWRATQDPYAILVSEMMLQQTRIETVLERGYFERWMRRFPSVAELAIASDEEILKLWEGLGYYRRARHLREAARSVVSRHGGVFPQEPSVVLSLPGVGDYTVGAIMAFAFDRAAPMIDGNVARVLARLYDFDESIDDPSGKRRLSEWSGRLTDPGRARRFQSGLMEIGQRLCKVQRPLCWECPVAAFCRTRRPEQLPVKRERARVEELEEHVGYFTDAGRRVFLSMEDGSRRSGLWRLPPLRAEDLPEAKPVLRFAYAITRYRVWLHVHAMPPGAKPPCDGRWVLPDGLEELAMASPYRRALRELGISEREA